LPQTVERDGGDVCCMDSSEQLRVLLHKF